MKTLGERCVEFAENEMKNVVQEDKPKSYTSPRIKEYFSICTRKINGVEKPIGITSGNWCAAGVSFCLFSSLQDGDVKPHSFRVGVLEIEIELKLNGLWRQKDIGYVPNVGDVVIFDRSQKNKPETSWWRHIGFVFSDFKNNKFKVISGNSGGKWRISEHSIDQATLMGFGKYPLLNDSSKVNSVDFSLDVDDSNSIYDDFNDFVFLN
jgi:hypothetical protein